MSFDDFYKRFTAFGIAFALGLFAAAYFYGSGFSGIFKDDSKPAQNFVYRVSKTLFATASQAKRTGRGDSRGDFGPDDPRNSRVNTSEKPAAKPVGLTEGVKILSKPRANYTEAARQNQVQGKVVLRVTFGANEQIGSISVISGLPEGLTEQSIAAARAIRFKPAKRGGVPYSVTKPVEYTFTIY